MYRSADVVPGTNRILEGVQFWSGLADGGWDCGKDAAAKELLGRVGATGTWHSPCRERGLLR